MLETVIQGKGICSKRYEISIKVVSVKSFVAAKDLLDLWSAELRGLLSPTAVPKRCKCSKLSGFGIIPCRVQAPKTVPSDFAPACRRAGDTNGGRTELCEDT